jgi:hypothetical protein
VNFLPIIERELRTAARQPATFRTRTGLVLVTSGVAALLLLVSDSAVAKPMGNAVFPVPVLD